MEVTNGSMSFGMTMDVKQLLQEADKILAAFAKISDKADLMGSVIDDWANVNEENISAQKEAIEALEKQYDKLSKTISTMDEGADKTVLQKKLKEVGDEIEAEKDNLDELTAVVESNKLAQASLATQLSKVKGEMQKLRQNGQEDTDEYRQLEEIAKRLSSTIRDVNSSLRAVKPDTLTVQLRKLKEEMAELASNGKEDSEEFKQLAEKAKAIKDALAQATLGIDGEKLKTHAQLISEVKEQIFAMGTAASNPDFDQAEYDRLVAKLKELKDEAKQVNVVTKEGLGFKGTLQEISALSGGITAVSGAMTLFGGKAEWVQSIQSKLQSLTAITVGLQSIEALKYKESASKFGIFAKMKEAFLKKMKEYNDSLKEESKIEEAANAVKEASETVTEGKTAAETASAAAANATAAAEAGVAASTGSAAVAEAAATKASWSLAGALRGIGAAIKSIPVIGWIIAAITAAIAAFKALDNAIEKNKNKVNEANKKWIEYLDNIQKYTSSRIDNLDRLHNDLEQEARDNIELAKAQGKSIEDIRKLEDDLMDVRKKNHKENVDAIGEDIDKLDMYEWKLGELQQALMIKNKLSSQGASISEDEIKNLESEIELTKEKIGLIRQVNEEGKSIDRDERMTNAQRVREDKERAYEDNRMKMDIQKKNIELMEESYAKQASLIKKNRQMERQELTIKMRDPSTSSEQQKLLQQQIDQNKKLEAKELSDLNKEKKAAIISAQKELYDIEYEGNQKQVELEYELWQGKISTMNEGAEKQLEQMRLNNKKRLDEIENHAKSEQDAIADSNMQTWLAEQRSRGRKVNDTDYYNSEYFKSLNSNGLTQEQQAKLDEDTKKRKEAQIQADIKAQTDFLNEMLSKYGEYTESKRRIDDEYSQNLNYLNEHMANAATEQQKQQIQEAIGNLKTEWAQKQFDLDMEVFDSSYFDSVDSKMQALNGVYAAYISNLTKAGASQEQLNAVTREWNSLTGKSAQLNAKLEDLEQEKALAVERGDIDLVKALNGEMSKLRKEQDKMQKDGEKKDFKTSLLDWWDENKKDLIVDGIDKIGGSIRQLGEASGNTGLKDLGEAVEGIGGLVQGFAQGGLIDGIVNAVSMIADEVVNVISANKQLEQAIDSANVDSWADRMDEMMQTDGIFGSDSIAQVNASVKVMREAQKQLQDVWKGGKVNAQDRSGFANFFGIKDDYRDLGDMARELGRDLYDSYGNLNSDTLQAILDTYSDLGTEDRKWMEEAIAYSDEYAEAMENVASYLEDLFGGVAGDIADKMVDAFIETGNAAVDLGDVVSDVGKKMAKDLIKSLIISTYFEDMEDDFNRRIAENGMNAETSSYIIGKFNEAVHAIEGDMTYWNNVIASLSGLWSGAAEDASATLGTSLGAASQESIDMMTGQLNAIRTHQITIESRVDSVLLSLAGIRQDMNANARNAEGYLDKIEINTRSTNNSLIRGFGL